MAINVFGLQIKRKKEEDKEHKEALQSPIQPEQQDGSSLETGGGYGAYAEAFHIGTNIKSENELIKKYRKSVLTPEVESAIDEIINDAIITDGNTLAVTVDYADNTSLSDSIKKKITEAFNTIYELLNFQEYGYEYFRNWYIDGRIAFYKNTGTNKNPKEIKSIQPIDPLKIRKIKKIKEEKKNGVPLISDIDVYYEYSRNGFGKNAKNIVNLSSDSVTYVTSGLMDESKQYTISHLHKALKPINQLNMMEDSIVIYRISRAPERRIFYIDVGNLPRQKSEQYVKDIMNRYRNKMVYNPQTGEVDDTRKYQTMLEDYWLPRRSDGKGTEVQTLPGGQQMSQIDDLEYFLQKVYKALDVPFNRLQGDNPAFAARATEITRDELKFDRFIQRLRTKFSHVFYDLLKTQLILQRIVTPEEWENIKNDIIFDFNKDSYFSEAKKTELLQQRVGMLRDMHEYLGTYFSKEYIMKNVLFMSDDEIDYQEKQIAQEKKDGKIPEGEEGGGGMF